MKRGSIVKTIEVTGRSPYAELYCPFCGTIISEPDGDELGECPHLVSVVFDEEPDESEYQEQDICLTFFEPPPAGRDHHFIFRPNP